MIRYSLILMSVCLCAALVLGTVNKITEPKIEAQMQTEEAAALEELFPDAEKFEKALSGEEEYYKAISSEEVIGYIITVIAKGYASDIDMRVGITKEGNIKAIKIISQQETPGLGARISEINQGEEKPWFLAQFEGRKPEELNLKNIDAITAATITSEAVIETVKLKAGEFLSKVINE